MPRQRCTEPSRPRGVAPIPRRRLLALPIGGLCLLLLTAWALSCNMLDRQGTYEPGTLGAGAGGGGQACDENADCPGLFAECEHPVCANAVCGTHYEEPGASCTENEGAVCDGAGECVECVDGTQCSGDEICQANECVPAFCEDGVLNGDESDLDCGGSCAPCENGGFCSEADDCQSGYCSSNGICAACSGQEDCDQLAEYCCVDGIADCEPGVCTDKEESSDRCDQAVECLSGFCPPQDGVCCDSACDGTCYACLEGKTIDGLGPGQCGPVSNETDPDVECAQQPESSCGIDGRGCDGAGACLLWPSGTVCDPQHCSGGDTQHHDDTCDGSGSCDDNGIDGCSPYICEGVTCRTSCTGDGHCLSGSWCEGANCVSSGNQGDPCGGDNECQSGHCEDGYCCESACAGECMACAASMTDGPNGDCQAITHNTDPANECSNGACYRLDANNGECRLYQGYSCGGNTNCMNDTCRDGYCCENGCAGECMACRGDWTVGNNGQCRAISTNTDPADECSGGACYNNSGTGECRLEQGQLCGSGSDCLNGICVDSRCCENTCNGTCVACRGTYTVGADGQCRAITSNTDPSNECSNGACWGLSTTSGECRSDQGQWCSSNSDCLNNRCRYNYCCNSDCSGDCQSCNGAQSVGANGICSDVNDGTDPNGDCADQGATSCGYTGDCDSGACEYYGTGTLCEARSCTNNIESPPSGCDGAGTCVDGGSFSCEPYTCDGDHCRWDCTNSTHCFPSYYCSPSNECLPY